MKTKRFFGLLSASAVCLLLTSCFDSKVPLSDPGESKADQRLIGAWRLRSNDGAVSYHHFGHVRGRLPASVMRMTWILHKTDGTMEQSEFLVFPTTIGDKTYLNVTDGNDEQMQLLDKKGWTAETVNAYYIIRYRVKDNVLTFQTAEAEHIYDDDAKQVIVGTGQHGVLKLSDEAKGFFKDYGCKVWAVPTPDAVKAWNEAKGKTVTS